MKTRRIIILALAGLFLCSIAIAWLSPQSNDFEEMYYWYKDQKVTLTPVSSHWVIGLRSNEESKVSSTTSSLSDRGIDIGHLNEQRMLISIPNTQFDRRALSEIKALSNVNSIRPLYQRNPGDPLLVISDELLVVFQDQISFEKATELGGKLDLTPDPIWNSYPTDIVLFRWNSGSESTLTSAMEEVRRVSGVKSVEPNIGNVIIPNNDRGAAVPPSTAGEDDPNSGTGIPISPDDPDYNQQWNLDRIRMPETWGLMYNDPSPVQQLYPVTIAILDTWTWNEHLDLAGVGRVIADTSYINEGHSYNPDFNHGTYVTGIAAALTNNNKRIAGVFGGWPQEGISPVNLILVELFGNTTNTNNPNSDFFSDAIHAFKYAAEKGAHVINCSWGTLTESSALEARINMVANSYGNYGGGCTVVFGSGNGLLTTMGSPENLDSVLSVGATDYNDVRYAYSIYDETGGLDIVAPSGYEQMHENTDYKIWVPTTGYTVTQYYNPPDSGEPYCLPITNYHFGGTSAAAPLASGVAALLYSIHPDLPSSEIRELIKSTAWKIQGGDRYYIFGAEDSAEGYTYQNGYNNKVGYGRLDAMFAVSTLLVSDYPLNKITGVNVVETQSSVPPPNCNCAGDPFAKVAAAPPSELWSAKLTWNPPDGEYKHFYLISRAVTDSNESPPIHYNPHFWTEYTQHECFFDTGLEAASTWTRYYWYRVAEVSYDQAQIGVASDPISAEIPASEGGGGGPESADMQDFEIIEFGINKIWPNPSNAEFVIRYGIEDPNENVVVKVINVRGQTVFTFESGTLPIGYHELHWNGLNDSGMPISTGIYLVLLSSGNRIDTKKITVIK